MGWIYLLIVVTTGFVATLCCAVLQSSVKTDRFLFDFEDVVIEEHVKLLIGVVYAELLE